MKYLVDITAELSPVFGQADFRAASRHQLGLHLFFQLIDVLAYSRLANPQFSCCGSKAPELCDSLKNLQSEILYHNTAKIENILQHPNK